MIGYRRGFTTQLGAFIGIVVGIIVCRVCGTSLAEAFISPGDTPGTRLLHVVLAYVLLFGACYFLGRVIGSLVHDTFNVAHLGFIDKIGGSVFKTCEYLLIFSILLNLWMAVFPNTDVKSKRAGLTPFVLDFAPSVFDSKLANVAAKQVTIVTDDFQNMAVRDGEGLLSDSDSINAAGEPHAHGERLVNGLKAARKVDSIVAPAKPVQASRPVKKARNAVNKKKK